MDETKIERYVVELLEISAVDRQGLEQAVWQTLHDLLMAVARFEQLSDDEKNLVVALKKKLQFFFSTNFSLKERKETKKKKNFPPNPLLKEKAKKETEEKATHTINGRREAFHQECLQFVGEYDTQRLSDFFNYYCEVNPATGKMRFEELKYWNIINRLKRWMSNSHSIADTEAALRLQRTKKRQSQDAESVERQRQAAVEREEADKAREMQAEADKQMAGGMEEHIAANPDGLLARIQREREKREKKAIRQRHDEG